MKSETDLLKAAEKGGGGFVWGLLILVFLFSVLLAGGEPASERSTPPPAGRQQAARPERPTPLVETAVLPAPTADDHPRPTSRPQQPANYTPSAVPTWTPQPTYTPPPTWTLPPTAVPSQTPLPTYTFPATQTALPTYTPVTAVPVEVTRPPLAAVVVPTPPSPGGSGIDVVGLVVSAVALSVGLVLFIFTPSRPIVVHVAPQRMILPPPTGQPIREVAPVQNTGVTGDTTVFAPVQEGAVPPAGRITLAVKPTDSEADMALIVELWTIYQSLPEGRKTANEVCAAKWGRGKDGQIKKNPGRMVLIDRAIRWGKEREARLRNQPPQPHKRPLIANKGQVEA